MLAREWKRQSRSGGPLMLREHEILFRSRRVGPVELDDIPRGFQLAVAAVPGGERAGEVDVAALLPPRASGGPAGDGGAIGLDRDIRRRARDPKPVRSEERRVGKECRSRWSP